MGNFLGMLLAHQLTIDMDF